MPESRSVKEGAISGAVPLSLALMRGAGKLGPKLLARLGRVSESEAKLESGKALIAATEGRAVGPEALRDVIKVLVGTDTFMNFLMQRPGAEDKIRRKVWGDESVDKVEQYRLLSSLGMPVDDDPRLGLNVVKTSDWRGLFRGQQPKMTVSEKQRREMYQEMEKAPWPWTKAGKALSKDLNANVPSIREGRDPMALSDEETRRAVEIFRKHREGR